jgi:hypothetical protein
MNNEITVLVLDEVELVAGGPEGENNPPGIQVSVATWIFNEPVNNPPG